MNDYKEQCMKIKKEVEDTFQIKYNRKVEKLKSKFQ